MRRIQLANAEDSREVWQAAGAGGGYWDGPRVSYPVVVRVGVPIAQVGPLLDRVRTISQRHNLPRLVTMHAGSGAGRVHLGDLKRSDDIGPLAAAAEAIRAAAESLGGHMIVETAPQAVKARVSVWGQVDAFEVMAEIKQQFDPSDTLNPGRFIK
jgi:glycolate oxidase FAD binding subunit